LTVLGLAFAERPVAGDPAGLLVLHHGRGTSELDLLPLADAVDPERKLVVVAPRAPLSIPGAPGHHWYQVGDGERQSHSHHQVGDGERQSHSHHQVPRVGHPDPETFGAAYRALAEFHDALWERTGIGPAETVLGGFSMGSAMSYALGLGLDRPPPAGILAWSGFIPTLEFWEPDLVGRGPLRCFVAHGRRDPVIVVDFARRAVARLEAAGIEVAYHESDVAHQISPATVPAAAGWLAETLGR